MSAIFQALSKWKENTVRNWREVSEWGVEAGSAEEAFTTRTINQLSVLAMAMGLVRVVVFGLAGDGTSLVTALLTGFLWIVPALFNRAGDLKAARISFLVIYLGVFVAFALLTSENYAHWGAFFVAVVALLFFPRKPVSLLFVALAVVVFAACEVWVFHAPAIFKVTQPLLGEILRGASVGIIFFVLIKLLLDALWRKEDQLAAQKDRLDAILEGALDGFITIDAQGAVTGWNQNAAAIFGWEKQEVLGRPLHEFIIPEKHRQAHLDGMERFHLTGEGPVFHHRVEVEGLRKNGQLFPVELSIKPVRNEGEEVFFSAFLRDITEEKAAREKLLRLNAELSQFASVASHDLKEPLRTISMYADIVAEEIPDKPEALELLEPIREASRRMGTLLDDLIAFARAESDAGAPHAIDLNQVLDTARKNLAAAIARTGADISAASPLPVALGNTTHYVQLFQNLLANAIKFQPSGNRPHIRIEAERSRELGRFWLLAFRDNGIGMPAETADSIFEPFARGNTGRQFKGSGLGLVTCRKVVERAGGKIWVESEEGKGSSFFVLLPAAE